MFTVYHSNQLDVLKTLVATMIAGRPLRDPFQPEVILVQSNGMAQWIQVSLASKFSIAANIKFSLPASFIWQMFTRVLPDIPAESAFAKSAMTWRLMKLLPCLCHRSDFAVIGAYLRNDANKRKCFQLAVQMADLFNQYLIFRPDWLESWQSGEAITELGEAQHWQASLWRALIVETERAGQPLWHRANLYQRFIQTLTQSQTRPPGLPDRVFVFGIPALSLTYLQALGRHIDIHLLFINPCRYYWGNICDHDFLTRLLHRSRRHYKQQKDRTLFRLPAQADALFDEQGEQQISNPLLASWGKQGRDNLYMLAQLEDVQEVDAFVEPTGSCLLSLIQRDILELEDHAVISLTQAAREHNERKRPLQPNDRSLSLHVCHSPYREVEVLHDSLLAMFSEDPTLRPRDVIVMVADVDRYTPAIKAVFGNVGRERHLPFAISDSRVRHIHPVLPAFLSLLDLPRSRFAAEQVLALLEVPALAARFTINEQGLQLLRHWVAESGIRWGLDDDMLRELMLPATSQHTWQFGLTRMLLGYAMDSQSGDWQGILPYDESSGLIASLAGHLAEFLMKLRYWRNQLAQPRYLNTWLTCAREMIDDFFAPDAEAQAALALLENHWQKMLQCGLAVGYNQTVSVTLLHDALSARLDKERVSQRFLTGSINFCTLTPMRSIPFRVVCLLGMNDGVYPRTLSPVGFDLITQQPRRGDRNRRDDDRYLFLEALLSAQHRLYISFIGRSIQDNTPCYPSTLVSELCCYISQSFYLLGDEDADAETSADRVYKHLWQWHSRMPFALENFLPGKAIQSFASEWLPAARAEGKPYPNFVSPLTVLSSEALSLDDMRQFYSHSVCAWFQQRLAVSFRQTLLELSANEPFVIDSLTCYQINSRIVNALINEQSTNYLFRQARAAGLLPFGAFGELYWIKQCQEMSVLAKQVRMYRLPHNQNLEVYLTLDNITLFGWLSQVQENGLLRWRPGYLSEKDGLLLWLEHLVYCAIGGKGESWMLGTRGEWHFPPLPANQAKTFLLSLVSDYYQGMVSPLLLLNRSGGAWLSHCFDWKTQSIDWDETRQQQARDKLIQAWQGDGFIPGEGNDPYVKRLIQQLDQQHIDEIIVAAERFLLPPFKFNLAKNKPARHKRKS
ncbi:MAG: exodeoxyribonuclease V subunit RecC [Sodalis sp. Psp]|nr:exodeoxyribonuclease V subunit RecC [Sodalis sp. Psp]MCR3757283.1 exodeoxyribonuclease V subunit RecC [Sodalis sp. Ppy]